MPKLILILSLSCLFLSGDIMGQKLKYKDILEMIESGDEDNSMNALRVFLADPKNEDHASANFQMGKIYDSKAIKLEASSEKLRNYVDSAIYFYDLAKPLITEKEVKKNEDYYKEFKRIDVRTGKNSVKSFDIRRHIDQRIKELREKL